MCLKGYKLKNKIFSISKPLAPLRKFNTLTSELETECIFGEKVVVEKNEPRWVYCKLLKDGYEGWIKKSSLGISTDPNYKVNTIKTIMFDEPNMKSNPFFSLTFGAEVFVKFFYGDWAEIHFYNLNKKFKKFIPKDHLICITKKRKDWVKIIEKFSGTPYKWGGKSSDGIDCSGLIQTAFHFQSNFFPRNTIQQEKLGKKILQHKKNTIELKKFYKKYQNVTRRGDLLFWSGHVAVALNNKDIIHANAFHMCTQKENICKTYERLFNQGYNVLIIKRLNN